MSASNRATKLTKAHKVLKKHYKPHSVAERPVLEHLLYACCLEIAPPEAADEAFARLQQAYYDWNEVRVTTVSELTEVMGSLPKPSEAASRLKRCLQSVFECYYSFDLEQLKKENLGKSVKQLERLDGISPFSIAFVTQNGLGGHAIAVSDDALEVLRVLGIVSDEEAKEKRVPGLERAIAKNKGVEFGSLLHQLGIDYGSAPFSPRVRAVLLEISPDAKERFPKRAAKKDEETGDLATPVASPSDADNMGETPTSKAPPSGKKITKKSADKGADRMTDKSADRMTDKSAEKKPPEETQKKPSSKRLTKKKPR